MPIKKPKKPSKKELIYHIALLRDNMFKLTEKIMLLESVINKYIEMKKDTKKFNKYLLDQIEGAKNEKAKEAKK